MAAKSEGGRNYATPRRSEDVGTRRGPLAAVGRIAQLLATEDLPAFHPLRLIALVIGLPRGDG